MSEAWNHQHKNHTSTLSLPLGVLRCGVHGPSHPGLQAAGAPLGKVQGRAALDMGTGSPDVGAGSPDWSSWGTSLRLCFSLSDQWQWLSVSLHGSLNFNPRWGRGCLPFLLPEVTLNSKTRTKATHKRSLSQNPQETQLWSLVLESLHPHLPPM